MHYVKSGALRDRYRKVSIFPRLSLEFGNWKHLHSARNGCSVSTIVDFFSKLHGNANLQIVDISLAFLLQFWDNWNVKRALTCCIRYNNYGSVRSAA